MGQLCAEKGGQFTADSPSCGQSQKAKRIFSFDELTEEFDNVLEDSTSTWEQVTHVANLFVDSLIVLGTDENNLRNRLLAQDYGYLAIHHIMEKYEKMSANKEPVNYDDIPPLLDKVSDAVNEWFYSSDERISNIWHDHYYVSHQESKNPVAGYFHIMITLPCEELPEPILQIFYPKTAEEDPILIFSKYLNDEDVREDPAKRETIHPEQWTKKGELETNLPMHVNLGSDAVKKMLDFDVLYLMFRSGVSGDGHPSEIETARLALAPLQAKWNEIIKSKLSN